MDEGNKGGKNGGPSMGSDKEKERTEKEYARVLEWRIGTDTLGIW